MNTANYLRDQLKWLTEKFPAPGGIYLSEFGFAEPVAFYFLVTRHSAEVY